MAYSHTPLQPQNEEYKSVFQQPVQDDVYDDEYENTGEYDFYEEELAYEDYEAYLTEEEMRQDKWRMVSGLGDFLGVIAGTVVLLLLTALLVSLINWVQADISQSFTLWQTKI